MRWWTRSIVALLAAWGLLVVAELAFLDLPRARRAWQWPRPLPEHTTPAPAARPALVVVATNRGLGAVQPATIERLLSTAGVVAVEAGVDAADFETPAQRVARLDAGPGTRTVLVLSAEDVARAGMTPPRDAARSWLARIAAHIPAVRFVVGGPRLVGAQHMPEDLWPFCRHGVANEAERWRPTRRALEQLRDAALKNGGRALVVWLPSVLEAAPATASQALAELAIDDFESSRPRRRLVDICGELGLELVDTTRTIERARRGDLDLPPERRLFTGQRLASVATPRTRRLCVREIVRAVARSYGSK